MGEYHTGSVGVVGSNPIVSTRNRKNRLKKAVFSSERRDPIMADRSAWQIMLVLLRCALTGEKLPVELREELSEEKLREIFRLSSSFDVAPLAATPLTPFAADFPAFSLFREAQYKALLRYERMERDLERVKAVFAQEQIPFIPLKGAVLRRYYPEPWMRTSCDVDILIHEDDLPRAERALCRTLSFALDGRTPVDTGFRSESGIHFELHYNLIADEYAPHAGGVLKTVWDTAAADGDFCYRMSDEMLYFYHIAHMAKHIINGGCGVRPFADLWLLRYRAGFDREACTALLQKGRLARLAEGCEALSEVWFGNQDHTEVTRLLEDYIISGGIYGNVANMVAVQENQRGGKAGYLLSRIFVPYIRLRNVYPVLRRHKWLTPVMEVRRWIDMVKGGRMNQTISELQSLQKGDNQNIKELYQLLDLEP